MIIDQFFLSAGVPENIAGFLQAMAEKKYPDLYEEEGDGDLNREVTNLVRILAQGSSHEGRLRLVWLGWILCMASFPTIDWVFNYFSIEDIRTDIGRQLFVTWKQAERVDAELWSGVEFAEIGKIAPQNLSEALIVFRNQKNICLSSDVNIIVALIEDTLELCLQGYAIAAGSADRRPILNWIVNYAVPSAYNRIAPEEFYTIHTNMMYTSGG